MFGKQSIGRSSPGFFIVWFMIVQMAFMNVAPLLALPQDESVTHGDVVFTKIGNSLVAVQKTGSAIVNYGSFDIASPETVRFIQPGSSAAILNRVTGGGGSTIAGALLANGRVYLINPNGILFSSSARVNVGGLVASAMNISDGDFLSGKMEFSGGGGSVVNEGNISAGFAYLVGGNVENRGSISARDVVLAAGGSSVLIDRAAGGEIRLTIDGEEARPAEFGWIEPGTVIGTGGNDDPDDEASGSGAAGEAGDAAADVQVELANHVPVTNGLVVNRGIITAFDEETGTGGSITLHGMRVAQYGTINADGVNGAGGSIELYADDLVHVSQESITTANAGPEGQGGTLYVYGENAAFVEFGSRMEIMGGELSGDGGMAEISAHGALQVGQLPNTSSPMGENGVTTLDPYSIFILQQDDARWDWSDDPAGVYPTGDSAVVDIDSVEQALDEYGGVIIRTDLGGGSQQGDISLDVNLNYDGTGSGNTLFFLAVQDIRIDGRIYDSSGSGDSLRIILQANNEITSTRDIRSGGGDIILIAGSFIDIGNSSDDVVYSSGGDIIMAANGYLRIDAAVDSNGGQIILGGGIDADTSGNYTFNASGNLDINATVDSDNGDIVLAAADSILIDGTIEANAGDLIMYAKDLDIDVNSPVSSASWITMIAGDDIFVDNTINAGYETFLAAGDLVRLNAGINSTWGGISVIGGHIEQNAAGDLTGADISVIAKSGSIVMQDGARSSARDNFHVAYSAATTATISGLDGNNGTVTVIADGNISDAGNTYVDVEGTAAMLVSSNGSVGTLANPLEINVDTIAGFSGGGPISLTQVAAGGSIAVGPFPAITIGISGPTGTIISVPITQIDLGLISTDGDVRLTALDGSITVDERIIADGTGADVRLDAQGAGSDVILNDAILASGDIDIQAADSVTQNGAAVISYESGSVVVQALGGSISMLTSNALTVANDGNIRYAAGQDVGVQIIASSNGNVSVAAGNNVTIKTGVFSAMGGSVDVEAQSGAITMASNALAFAGLGNMRFRANGDVTIGSLVSTQMAVSVTSLNGSILDAVGPSLLPDIVAARAMLRAANGSIGTLGGSADPLETAIGVLAAKAGSGGINILNLTGMDVDTVAAVTVNRVLGTGSTTPLTDATLSGLDTDNNGSIVGLVLGPLNVNESITADGNGNILLGTLTGVVNNLTLDAPVTSGSGNISLIGGRSVVQTAAGDVGTVGGDIRVISGGGDISMANGARSSTAGGNIQYISVSNVVVGGLDAGSGQVSVLTLDGSITDGGDAHRDIVASAAQLLALGGSVGTPVGVGFGPLDTDVDLIAAIAGGGDVSISELDDVTVGYVAPIPITGVGFDGADAPTNTFGYGGLIATNSSVLLSTINGSITVTSAVLNAGSGNILLDANGAGSDITINDLVAGVDGNVSIIAADSIVQNTNVGTLAGGTVDVEAEAGFITMAPTTLTFAGDGNIRYKAQQDVTLTALLSTQGNVSVVSTVGSILDGGDTLPEIVALQAQLSATNGGVGVLGVGVDSIETVVDVLAAQAGAGGINVVNLKDLIVDTVPPVTVNRVLVTDLTTPVTDPAMSGLTTDDDGSIVGLVYGALTVNEPVAADGSGNILLVNFTSVLNNATFNAPVSSGSGNISIVGGASLFQNAAGDFTTTGGDVRVIGAIGDIVMADGAETLTHGGNIQYVATTNVILGSLNAATGNVSVMAAAGSILDGGDTHRDIIAAETELFAFDGDIGVPTNAIETTVDILAAVAVNGGIRITESDDLIVGGVDPITIRGVNVDATVTLTNTLGMAGLIASNGSILVDTDAGSITVTSGVFNVAPGNVLLQANGDGSDITVSNLILAADGNMSLLAEDNVFQFTNIVVGGTGTLDVAAHTGGIWMADGAISLTASGSVRYAAESNIVLSSLISPRANVSVYTRRGKILDGGDALQEIIAPGARLKAYHNIGRMPDPLDTLVLLVTAWSSIGSIYIINDTIIAVTTIPDVTVRRVQPDDTLVDVTDAALSDLATGQNGNISLSTINGSIIVTDGDAPLDDYGIKANGSGNVRLDANGPDSFIVTTSGIKSDSGNICLLADNGILFSTGTYYIRTGGSGSIAIWADEDGDSVGDIFQLDGTIRTENGPIYMYGQNIWLLGDSLIESERGDVSVYAEATLLLANQGIRTGGDLILEGGSLTVNNRLSGDTVALRANTGSIRGSGKVVGDEVSLYALIGIGSSRDPFDVRADTLAVLTLLGDAYIDAEGSVIAGWVFAPDFSGDVPACAVGMPVAEAMTLRDIRAGGYLALNVEEDLSGGTVSAGRGDADVNVGGSVNGLDLLSAGDDIHLNVGGSYRGREINAGDAIIADIGDRLTFDEMNAGRRIDVNAYRIDMGRVRTSGMAKFRAGRNIRDNGSYIRAGDLILIAGGDIGPDSPIEMDVRNIDTIQAGGDVNVVQHRGGDTPIGLLSAGGYLTVRVPNGGLVDRNGDALNLQASGASIDARRLGTMQDALEAEIGPGNLKVNGAGLSGADTPGDYIFVNINGVIGWEDGWLDYIGTLPIPGVMILNGQLVGGPAEVMNRFFRAKAFLAEVPHIIEPEGLFGKPFFIDMQNPTREAWEIFIYYILRQQADIVVDFEWPVGDVDELTASL